jgi:hypothetical protein
MPKVCIQAGHKNMTSGATGAPGERDWNSKIVPLISNNLRAKGLEVYETDAFGNNDKKVISTDWDLFLSIHYDADIYNESGGFVDIPDKSVDLAHENSKRIAGILSNHYFTQTKILNRPSRSNANTKFYYMWQSLTAKTPCVIIECGVGWRKPNDYEILRKYDFIAKTISDGILLALDIKNENECEEKLKEKEEELKEMRNSRNKWKKDFEVLEKENSFANKNIKDLEKKVSDMTDENKRLINELTNSEINNDLLKQVISKKEVEVKEVYEKINDLQNENNDLKLKLNNGISAFSIKELIKEIVKKLKK